MHEGLQNQRGLNSAVSRNITSCFGLGSRYSVVYFHRKRFWSISGGSKSTPGMDFNSDGWEVAEVIYDRRCRRKARNKVFLPEEHSVIE